MVFKSTKKENKKKEQAPIISPRVTPTTSHVVPQPSEPASRSYIGKTMNIEADITSDEDIIIEGTVKGNIVISKTLTIGKNGNVEADIEAAVVRIIGQAKGNVIASKKVEILSEGRFTGNIDAQRLVVADGALLNGHINQQVKMEERPETAQED
jgi:cytoskeletal protein CcmA (bactofilin family)